MTLFGQPWSTIGQTPLKTPWIPLCHPVSAGTFATFSKFHLNTSKSPKVKVVCCVEGHNFHVEWDLKFGVEMCEKFKSTPQVTIHRRPENSQLGMRFVNSWLRKTLYGFCRSCRGLIDLQLCYSPLGPLLFKNLEICAVERA
jgi:hypothetical protein